LNNLLYARLPLSVGNKYIFKSNPKNGFEILDIDTSKGHFSVFLKWFGFSSFQFRYYFPDEEKFWLDFRFKNAFSPIK